MRSLWIPLLLGAAACGSSSVGGAGTASDSGAHPSDASSGSCSPDPLHTGLVAMQTGVSVDAFDCYPAHAY